MRGSLRAWKERLGLSSIASRCLGGMVVLQVSDAQKAEGAARVSARNGI